MNPKTHELLHTIVFESDEYNVWSSGTITMAETGYNVFDASASNCFTDENPLSLNLAVLIIKATSKAYKEGIGQGHKEHAQKIRDLLLIR